MSDAEKPALDLDALAALADAATPGPWSGERDPGSSMYFVLRNVPGDYIHIATHGWTWADVNFIGHAREAVPALIARVREAEAERSHWQGELRTEILRNRRMLDVMADEAAIVIRERDELRANGARMVREVSDATYIDGEQLQVNVGTTATPAWFDADWQAGEAEASADIAAGRTTSYESGDDFLEGLT